MKTKQDVIDLFNDRRLAPRAVGRALVVLYKNQTTEEQRKKDTIEQNNKGFSSCHADVGTTCAEYFLKYNHLQSWMVNFWLGKPTPTSQKRIVKYHRQLILAANNSKNF